MKIKEYIESGILEAYVLGSASETETKQLLHLKDKHPEIGDALLQLEVDLEKIAQHMAITPPPVIWNKIEDHINELVVTPDVELANFKEKGYEDNRAEQSKNNLYIEVEGESSHMRIHKAWRWVFAAVFVLGKIFLAFAIYYYLENRQAKEQIEVLKTELNQMKTQ